MIALIDYGSGNLKSAGKALEAAGAVVRLVATPAEMEGASAVVLPGVGAFGDAARQLEATGLMAALRDWLRNDRPFLGICIGYQLLFETSAESPEARGIGFFEGEVVRFSAKTGLKVPHMGWNSLSLKPSPLWAGLPPNPYVYFVHSYFPQPRDESLIIATAEYGETIPAAIGRGNIFATQFHPEKSQEMGLHILKNWVSHILDVV
ncbi:MAG: imidazole glycerol phosphate synthase subunit HisH [Verrucomicrobiia bacterium]